MVLCNRSSWVSISFSPYLCHMLKISFCIIQCTFSLYGVFDFISVVCHHHVYGGSNRVWNICFFISLSLSFNVTWSNCSNVYIIVFNAVCCAYCHVQCILIKHVVILWSQNQAQQIEIDHYLATVYDTCRFFGLLETWHQIKGAV